MKRLGAIVERAPAEDPVVAQLKQPGHLVLARRRTVLVPHPDPPDQRHCRAAARLGAVLVEILEDDRLLDAAGRPRRPEAGGLDAAAQPPHRVQLDLGIEDGDEAVEVTLVERPDELPYGVYAPWHFLNFLPEPHQQGSLRPMSRTFSSLTTVSTTSGAAARFSPLGAAAPTPTVVLPDATSCSADGCASGVPPE